MLIVRLEFAPPDRLASDVKGVMEPRDTKQTQSGKRVVVTIEVTAEDAKRLDDAFAAGKLSDIGVIDIKRIEEVGEKRWTAAEDRNKNKTKNAGIEGGQGVK